MSAACSRRVASTACAAVALLLASGGAAHAAPPTCTPPPPQTTVIASHRAAALRVGVLLRHRFRASDVRHLGAAGARLGTESGGFLTYLPEIGYAGPDTFSFTAYDGTDQDRAGGGRRSPIAANQPPTCPTNLSFEAEPGHVHAVRPVLRLRRTTAISSTFDVVDGTRSWDGRALRRLLRLHVHARDTGYQGADSFIVVARGPPRRAVEPGRGQRHGARSEPPTKMRDPGHREDRGRRAGAARRLFGTTCWDPDGDTFSVELVSSDRCTGHFEFKCPRVSIDFVPDPRLHGHSISSPPGA